jgi:uncharacterized protein (UPF0276 family)
MHLGVNYSPQAAALFRGGRVALDRWKCSDWPELIAGARTTGLPHYFHFALDAGPGDLDDADLRHVEVACAESATPYVNLHVAVRRADYPGIPPDSRVPADVEAALARTARDVRAVAARFGPERVIVENLPYRGPDGARLRLGQEADFLRRLCAETGCGFLLDVAHARTAARFLGLDERSYLASLPVDRLRELHVSGLLRGEDGGVRDEHMALDADDWALLGWCLDHIRWGRWARPWLLAMEYGGIGPRADWRSDPAVLAAQLPRLRALIRDL